MRVLIACEYSAVVRDAFRALGHDAWSCDLLPCERDPRWHLQGDVIPALGLRWDLLIAHPPCTDLAVSGARWFAHKRAEDIRLKRADRQTAAVEFARKLYNAPVPRIALENPISILSSHLGKPSQVIQPWMFGHGEVKATCLWLKGLPLLTPTNVVEGREARVHKMAPSPDRWRERSRTLEGIAAAMAAQWGAL